MISLDYFLLERLVAELKPALEGARVAKIHQPSADCLVLRLWNGRQNLRLLLNAGSSPRLHLTEQEFPNPFQPPRFCQLLRARLKRLLEIRVLGTERIVELHFRGDNQHYRLVCELLGTRSNLFLLDADGLLLDALHKPQVLGERTLKRGVRYELPQPRTGLRLSDPQLGLPETIETPDDFQDWLLREIVPMSKAQALVLKEEAQQGGDIPLIFKAFQQGFIGKKYDVGMVRAGGKEALVASAPEILAPVRVERGGLNAFLDSYFSADAPAQAEVGFKSQYRQLVVGRIRKLQKRLKQIGRQEESTGGFAEKKEMGQLLLANLHQVKKGMTELLVTDWSGDAAQQVRIPLDPQISPQENAERLFKRYKKDRRGVEHVERRLRETQQEIDWLEGLLLALDEAHEAVEINEVGRELHEAGLLKLSQAEAANRKRSKTQPLVNQTRSPAGLRIFWGRNNRSNDHLSTQMTERDDLWFHAHNMPGCHLVLKRDGRTGELPVDDIAYAAQLAAGYSRGKDAGKVEVIVTEGRNVSRPKGAKPGLVTLREYRTLVVQPLRLAVAEKAQ